MDIGFILIVLTAILLGRWAEKKKRRSGIAWSFLGLFVLSFGYAFLASIMESFGDQVDLFTSTFLALTVCVVGGALMGLIIDSLPKKPRVTYRARYPGYPK